MRNIARVSWSTLLAVIALGLFAPACAGDKEDVNYVQPGYIAKADLEGKSWYYRRTVVDFPETHDSLSMYWFSGAQFFMTVGTGDSFMMERIRWDVQENILYARRDYEYTPGTENAEQPGADYAGDLDGTVVAAFPIISHFDIIRQYNSQTGEEGVVVREDMGDRVWYDREYIRVDWKRNINPNPDFWVLPIDILDSNQSPGGDYFIHPDDATHPDRAHLTPEKGYIDWVSNHYLIPDWWTCIIELNLPYSFCGPGEARIRHAFMEVDPAEAQAYQPLDFPDSVIKRDTAGNEIYDPQTGEVEREEVFGRFGYFRLERPTYDRYRARVESGVLRRINRFNIWERSLDANGNPLPYAERRVRRIVYYLNWDFPTELVPTALEVGEQWNDVFKEAVAEAQGYAPNLAPTVFEVRVNSCSPGVLNSYLAGHPDVRSKVDEAMGGVAMNDTNMVNFCAATEYFSDEDFVWQRMGDPRFNMLYWIPNITASGFAGYGPAFPDPITGRTISATAFIMGWTIEDAATRALEYIDYINGAITVEDLLGGHNLPDLYVDSVGNPTGLAAQIAEARERAQEEASPEHIESLMRRLRQLGSTPAERLVPIDNDAHFDERLGRVAGTSFEREYLIRPEDLMRASGGQWQPGDVVPQELWDSASLIKDKTDFLRRDMARRKLMDEHTFCPLANLDDALIGLAKDLKDMSRDDRRQYLRRSYLKAVLLHEVGHNLGLRHNFEGSYDALNYDRTFWDIETDPSYDTAAASDPLHTATQLRLLDRQSEYMYSSIMDYHGKINADFQGLGAYDRAAIKMGYVQRLETFDDPAISRDEIRTWKSTHDYKGIPTHFNENLDRIYNRGSVEWDWTADTYVEPPANEVPYMFCSDDYAGWTPTCRRFDFGANQREVMEAHTISYWNYFIFSNYLRNRLTLPERDRAWGRFWDARITYQYMYLYGSQDPEFLNTEVGVDYATASAVGLNLMTSVISMPEPGTYVSCTAADGRTVYYHAWDVFVGAAESAAAGSSVWVSRNRDICNPGNRMTLKVPEAQPLFLDLTFEEDFVNPVFTYFGTYWDKDTAMFLMTHPSAYFFRTNLEEDRRMYSVSPYRIYAEPIIDLFTDLAVYDYAGTGGYYDPAGVDGFRYSPRMLVDPNQPLPDFNGVPLPDNPGTPRIASPLVRTIQRNALMYGLALLTSPLEARLDFAKHSRITIAGAADDISGLSGVISCTRPGTGITYLAAPAADGYDIGYELVSECRDRSNEFIAASDAFDAALAAYTADPTEANNLAVEQATDILESAENRFGSAQQMVQYTRLAHMIFEYGIDL